MFPKRPKIMCTGSAGPAAILRWATPTRSSLPKRNAISRLSNVLSAERSRACSSRIFLMIDFLLLRNRKPCPSVLASIAALFLAVASAASAKDPDFWTTWDDGKAELDGYTLTQIRDGEPRQGKAVMIFAADQAPAKGKFPVLKLTVVRDFQSGIDTCHILTSITARVDDHFSPSKISVSVQDWGGHAYQDLLIEPRRAEESLHSAFGEEVVEGHVHRIR